MPARAARRFSSICRTSGRRASACAIPSVGLSGTAGRACAGAVVISAAGSVDHDAVVAWAAERDGEANGSPAHRRADASAADSARTKFERKETEQYHICVGGPGISRHDDRRFALRLLDTVFVGTSSSLLFQEIRERRGLAYAVYSFTGAYQDTGQVGLYLGTRTDNLVQAMEVQVIHAG